MPHTSSAKKRLRQDAKRRLRNKSVKTHLKTRAKKFDASLTSGDVEETKKQAVLLQKSFDKAVSHGIVPSRTADRKKSAAAVKLSKFLRARSGA